MDVQMPSESLSAHNDATFALALSASDARIDPYPVQADTTLIGGDPGPQFFLDADERAGATVNNKISYTIDQAANQIIRGEPGWSAALGVGATVTYAYRASAPLAMPDDSGGVARFNATQINEAELALKAW